MERWSEDETINIQQFSRHFIIDWRILLLNFVSLSCLLVMVDTIFGGVFQSRFLRWIHALLIDEPTERSPKTIAVGVLGLIVSVSGVLFHFVIMFLLGFFASPYKRVIDGNRTMMAILTPFPFLLPILVLFVGVEYITREVFLVAVTTRAVTTRYRVYCWLRTIYVVGPPLIMAWLMIGLFFTDPALIYYNGRYGTSDGICRRCPVENADVKHTECERRNACCVLKLRPWLGEREQVIVEFAEDVCDSVKGGSTLCDVVVKSGRLGWRWIVSADVVTNSSYEGGECTICHTENNLF